MSGTFTHTNMRTGCAVVYLGGTCLGVSVGDTEVSYELQTRERLTARMGETPIDIIHIGEKASVTVPLAEQDVTVLEAAFPEGSTTSTTRYFGRIPGGTMSTHAGALLVRPVDLDASDDSSQDIVLYKAVVTSMGPIGYNVQADRIFAVTFTAYAYDTNDDGKKLGYIKGAAAS